MSKRILGTALTAVILISPAAFAWDNSNIGPGPKQIVDGGPGAQAVSRATAASHAAAQSRATGGAATSAGGSVTGGQGNVSVGTAGAPSFALPSIGGGGFDCPTVGFGAAGAGLGGGGGIGPSWISSDCNKRKVADLLHRLWGPGVARAYVVRQIDGVSAAIAAATEASLTPEPAATFEPAAWCAHATPAQRARNASCTPR